MTDLAVRPVDPQSVVDEIVSSWGDPGSDADKFKIEYLREQAMSKFFDPAKSDLRLLRQAAVTSMEEAEAICARVNEEGLNLSESVKYRIRYIIAEVLGDIDFQMFAEGRFSSGSTVGHPRKRGDAYFKYRGDGLTVTSGAYKYAVALIRNTPAWEEFLREKYGAGYGITIVPGGKFDTVRKNSKTDREIEPQPTLLVYLQRAVGLYIRSRLTRLGLDLRKNQKVNAEMARKGSITDDSATVDLRMASALISDRVVWEFVPPEWYQLLDDLRTKYCTMPKWAGGGLRKWERFSSMGNGFTFELETLIFYAIAKAACEDSSVKSRPKKELAVYGDDIIVPSAAAPLLYQYLAGCGFLVNEDKSFVEGPFRESCGKHYYQGVDVTPFYIRKPIDTLPRVCWLLNKMRLWSSSPNACCDPRVYPLWLKLRRRHAPKELLGGRDIESQDSVFSPEEPRKRLLLKRRRRHVDGVPCLLRYWQGLNHDVPESYGFDDEQLGTHEVPLNGVRVTMESNIPPWWVSRCQPAEFLFPQEL